MCKVTLILVASHVNFLYLRHYCHLAVAGFLATWCKFGEFVEPSRVNQSLYMWHCRDYVLGSAVEDMQVGCLWQGDFLITVSLSGFINYLDQSSGRLSRVVKVWDSWCWLCSAVIMWNYSVALYTIAVVRQVNLLFTFFVITCIIGLPILSSYAYHWQCTYLTAVTCVCNFPVHVTVQLM